MARLDRRLELLVIKHKSLFNKPALIRFYALGEVPTELEILENKKAEAMGRVVINFYARQMGSDDEAIKRPKKRSKKR